MAKIQCEFCESTFTPKKPKVEKELVVGKYDTRHYTHRYFECPVCGETFDRKSEEITQTDAQFRKWEKYASSIDN